MFEMLKKSQIEQLYYQLHFPDRFSTWGHEKHEPCSLRYCHGFRWEWMGSLVVVFFGGGWGKTPVWPRWLVDSRLTNMIHVQLYNHPCGQGDRVLSLGLGAWGSWIGKLVRVGGAGGGKKHGLDWCRKTDKTDKTNWLGGNPTGLQTLQLVKGRTSCWFLLLHVTALATRTFFCLHSSHKIWPSPQTFAWNSVALAIHHLTYTHILYIINYLYIYIYTYSIYICIYIYLSTHIISW